MMRKRVLFITITLVIPLFLFASSLLQQEALISSLHLHNSEIIELQQQLLQSSLDTQQAKAQRFGSLTLDLSASFMENPPIGPITIGSDELLQQLQLPSQGTNQYITLYDGMESTYYSGELTYRLPLFTWGKINSSIRLYSALETAYEAQYSDKLKEAETKISSYTSSLYHVDKIISLLEEQKSIAKEIISFAKSSVDVDLLTPLEYREKQLQLFPIEQALLEAKQQQKELYLSLEQLTGFKDLENYTIVDPINIEEIRKIIEQPLSLLLERATSSSNNSIKALDAMKRVSQEASTIAKASTNGKPDIALEISAGYAGSRFPFIETDWYGQDDYSFTISVGMRSTLFDGLRNVTAAKKAESDIVIARAQKEQALSDIENEVKKRVSTISTGLDKLSILSEMLEILNEKSQLLQQKVDLGATDEITLKSHQLEVLNTQLEKQQLLLKIELSYIELLYLL